MAPAQKHCGLRLREISFPVSSSAPSGGGAGKGRARSEAIPIEDENEDEGRGRSPNATRRLASCAPLVIAPRAERTRIFLLAPPLPLIYLPASRDSGTGW